MSTQGVELCLYLLLLLLHLPLSPVSTYTHSLTLLVCATQPLFSRWYLTKYHIVSATPELYRDFRVQTGPTSAVILSILSNICPAPEFLISCLFSVMFMGFSRSWNKHVVHTLHVLATNIVLIVLLRPGIGLFVFLLVVTCVVTIILYDTRACFSTSEYVMVTTFLSYVIYKTIFDETSSYVIFVLLAVAVFLVLPPRLDRDATLIVLALFCWIFVIFSKNLTFHLTRIESMVRITYMDVTRHPLLIMMWCACLVISVLFTLYPSTSLNLHVQRKLYHVMICVVYVSGMIYAPTLLSTSCLVISFIMLFCEVMYHRGVVLLVTNLDKLCGGQDTGSLVLTPFFLLLGLSIPVWWRYGILSSQDLPTRDITPLLQAVLPYSGVMSIGVGDAVAAIIGVLYGTTKLPRSHKTLEGFVANIVGQILFVVLISPYLVWGWSKSWDYLALGGIVLGNSLLEVYTQDIDNLVVPVFTTLALHVLHA